MTLGHHHPVEFTEAKKDHLWRQISSLPYFRGLLRAVEARFYENIELPAPTMDLGCGDGHFATLAFDRPLEVGIDPWTGPIREAIQRSGYLEVIQGSGDHIPFEDGHFASAVSNSVLEHIPELEPVLQEVARVLKPGAPFIFCVPNQNFLSTLSISRFFDRIHLRFLGNAYRSFFNTITRHHHCDDPRTWQDRLERAGFELVDWWHYFSPHAEHVLEWGHYFGLPSLITRKMFGRWILMPYPWNLALTRAVCQKAYSEASIQPEGTYTFYIARRK
jgi:SAM-dependent methyltransferase